MLRMSSNSCFCSFPFDVFFAVLMRTSVVLPMAETTTAIRVPRLASLTTEATAFDNRSLSARLEPPNFTTIFLPDFKFSIQPTIHAQNLTKTFQFVLGLVKIIIKAIAEAKEPR